MGERLLLAGAFGPDDIATGIVAGIVPVAGINDFSGVAAETFEDDDFVVFPAAFGREMCLEAIGAVFEKDGAVCSDLEGARLLFAIPVIERVCRGTFGLDVCVSVDEGRDGILAIWRFEDHLVVGVDKAGLLLVRDACQAVACACEVEFFVCLGDFAFWEFVFAFLAVVQADEAECAIGGFEDCAVVIKEADCAVRFGGEDGCVVGCAIEEIELDAIGFIDILMPLVACIDAAVVEHAGVFVFFEFGAFQSREGGQAVCVF